MVGWLTDLILFLFIATLLTYISLICINKKKNKKKKKKKKQLLDIIKFTPPIFIMTISIIITLFLYFEME